jgi:NAD(P)-dependent dehydrogenase (short-subunit alcohol dehydrogenase family)
MDITGKTAVVTGGGSGIGRGVGTLFAEQGMKVVLADMNAEVLSATVDELRGKGHQVTGVATDVADFDAVQRLADVAFETYGNVHVLMNNAGTGGGGTFDDTDMTGWRRAIGVNVEGTLHGILAFLPRMLANDEEGYITGTTSGSGAQGTMYSGAPYAATKMAVLSIMESLYGYLRDRGSKIRAACLFPPLTRSGMGSPMVVDMLRAGGVPAALAEPEELAQVVLEGIRNDAFWLNPTPDQDQRFFGGKLAEIHAWQNEMVMAKAHAMIEQTPPDPYLWTPVMPSRA